MELNRKELAEHVGTLISQERNVTHGDPALQFTLSESLLDIIHSVRFDQTSVASKNPISLGSVGEHALKQIITKISRLIIGSNNQDTWLDIAGYALIAAEYATEGKLTKPDSEGGISDLDKAKIMAMAR